MRSTCGRALALVSGAAVLLAGWTLVTGCGGGTGGPFQWFGGYWIYPLQGAPATSGTTSTGVTTGTSGTSSTSGSADPCQEPQARKFVRISMRNASDTYVHYFFVLIAFVNGTTYPTGSVCPTDIPLYTSFGYTQIPDGQQQTFGNYCITGPALLYMHRNGQFQAAGGTGAALASAIAPAQGTTPTYDAFFTASSASVPVPDRILFYNPGTTPEGLALKISRNATNP